MMDTGCWMMDAGYWMFIRRAVLNRLTGKADKMLDIGYLLLTIFIFYNHRMNAKRATRNPEL
jgi:hypothetical protein